MDGLGPDGDFLESQKLLADSIFLASTELSSDQHRLLMYLMETSSCFMVMALTMINDAQHADMVADICEKAALKLLEVKANPMEVENVQH